MTLVSTDPHCPSNFDPVASVATTDPKTAREAWPIPAVTGRVFKLVFGEAVSGYQPFVNELQFKVDGAWRTNNDTAGRTIVLGSSGQDDPTPSGGADWMV